MARSATLTARGGAPRRGPSLCRAPWSGAAPPPATGWRAWTRALAVSVVLGWLASCASAPSRPGVFTEVAPGVSRLKQTSKRGPWAMAVVRVERSDPTLAFESAHALGTSLGLSTLSHLLATWDRSLGEPVAAINGDFFLVPGRSYAGDARGLQIAQGRFLSCPTNNMALWFEAGGRPRCGRVASECRVTWADGRTLPVGFNEAVRTNRAVLFTPALGWAATGTTNALDLVLEPAGPGPWPPDALGQTVRARITAIRPFGNTPLGPRTCVLALPWPLAWDWSQPRPGDELEIHLQTRPDLAGVRTAIGGGPILLHEGRRQPLPRPGGLGPMPYEYRSMRQRHPRSAVGWNEQYFFLVVVDGRRKKHSVGMTLRELARYMAGLGCREAFNLDGGGSATLWCGGQVLNRPSDDQERDVANALVVVRRRAQIPASSDGSGLAR